MTIEYLSKTNKRADVIYNIKTEEREPMYGMVLRLLREDLKKLKLSEEEENQKVHWLYFQWINFGKVDYSVHEEADIMSMEWLTITTIED